ncbi:MAG: type II toxin-antitoxin system VapC family toxin [Spirochaetia bacterium]|nr:type II toxin-antitoxin system VapC family toxin [Spirochaetia bacterium]
MAKVVIDSNAMLALLYDEPQGQAVSVFMKNCNANNVEMIMSAVNYGEVYYSALRKRGHAKAAGLYGAITAMPVKIVEIDVQSAEIAAGYKAGNRMSYAYCFTAALAKRENAVILTGDPEFKQVEKEIKILWI